MRFLVYAANNIMSYLKSGLKEVGFPPEPLEGDEFPKLTETKPGQFEATYVGWMDCVKGWVIGELAGGSGKRPYRFEVRWHKGKPNVTVSTADPSNEAGFDDRDGPGKPIRELTGMPSKHRRDLHDYALRVAKHVRTRVFEEEDWLREQFATTATPIEVDAKTRKPTRFAFLQGWLLVEETYRKGSRVRAYSLGAEATQSLAKRAAERFVANDGRGDWRGQ
jgi:hypothetical protein